MKSIWTKNYYSRILKSTKEIYYVSITQFSINHNNKIEQKINFKYKRQSNKNQTQI